MTSKVAQTAAALREAAEVYRHCAEESERFDALLHAVRSAREKAQRAVRDEQEVRAAVEAMRARLKQLIDSYKAAVGEIHPAAPRGRGR
jgi:hypothetical protein